jgi:hypothetical protein
MSPGWILLIDAVTMVVNECKLERREAARRIVAAARNGELYTQGRLDNAKGPPFAISPAAWDGMDPYPARNTLCTPNPGTVVQEPFLQASKVEHVEIDGGSLDAWMAGRPRPPAPHIDHPVPEKLRKSPLVWLDLHPNPEVAPIKHAGGAPYKCDWPALEEALKTEIDTVGFPDKKSEPGWRSIADVAIWLGARVDGDVEVKTKTLRSHAKRMLNNIRAGAGQN